MAKGSLSDSELKESGVTENFIRLSIGLESAKDLMEDLDHALKSTTVRTMKCKTIG